MSDSQSPDTMLSLRGLSKRYADGTVALAPLDLDIPRGQFCVLLGASGAGKSTLIRAINGLLIPSAGEIRLEGRALPPGKTRARRGAVATIHQAVDLVPRLSVLDNVLSGDLGRMSVLEGLLGKFGDARRRRACELLAEVGLEPVQLYRRAADLSGGQQQRVGIARAFMAAPSLVLADEPVASLDPARSREILSLLRRAARDHRATVLCSLHQVELALEFADRVLGMQGGRLILDCRPAELGRAQLDTLYAAERIDLAAAA